MAAVKNKKLLPPCPDPEKYILVKTKEGYFWRRKRGTVRPAKLNEAFKRNTKHIQQAAPAAKRIVSRLGDFVDRLATQRIVSRISGMFIRSMNEKGEIDFSFLKDFEIQPAYPLHDILQQGHTVKINNGRVVIQIPIHKSTVKRLNNLVTHYWFELVLLYGDATKDRSLRIESISSSLYEIKPISETTCILETELPAKKQWLAFLKLSSLEGKELAAHPKHYGMKIVAAG